jgi:hypothetical protein
VLNANRGRLKAGHPGVVGGRCRRQPLNPASVSAVLLPILLLTVLILIMLQAIPKLGAVWHSSRTGDPLHRNALDQAGVRPQDPSLDDEILAGTQTFAALTPQVQYWSAAIDRWSRTYDLPPELIMIVMQIESCGDPDAVSQSGAKGLFQVMPFHFGTGEDMFSPETNAERGLNYLRQSYRRAGGRIDLTLAGYNGGLSQIDTPPELWPKETRRYVRWGTGMWSDLERNPSQSETLSEWLAAGGSRLCRDAQTSQSVR